ncbi:hypothetical protein DERF_001691 [Dermatophagoides farinae]|uniref:Uncharacterized protein n=1 Tax=Dermatophagoides farinae TaxID=6954 RepID=A0A922IE78_DERFA|nr:hypothetical protein DERF_001691 [Dermatophagoides farinae]
MAVNPYNLRSVRIACTTIALPKNVNNESVNRQILNGTRKAKLFVKPSNDDDDDCNEPLAVVVVVKLFSIPCPSLLIIKPIGRTDADLFHDGGGGGDGK